MGISRATALREPEGNPESRRSCSASTSARARSTGTSWSTVSDGRQSPDDTPSPWHDLFNLDTVTDSDLGELEAERRREV